MAFFDKFKDVAGDIADKAGDLAGAGIDKAKELAEIAKLNLANNSEEDDIKKAYLEIGKLYYAERGMAPEAAYASLCARITTAKTNIEENKAKITEVKEGDAAAAPAEEQPSVVENVPPEEPTTPAPEEPPKEQ